MKGDQGLVCGPELLTAYGSNSVTLWFLLSFLSTSTNAVITKALKVH